MEGSLTEGMEIEELKDDPEVTEWVKKIKNKVASTYGLNVTDKVIYLIIYEFGKVLKTGELD